MRRAQAGDEARRGAIVEINPRQSCGLTEQDLRLQGLFSALVHLVHDHPRPGVTPPPQLFSEEAGDLHPGLRRRGDGDEGGGRGAEDAAYPRV